MAKYKNVKDDISETVVETVKEVIEQQPKKKAGIVVNCDKLRVRDSDSVTGNVLYLLESGSEVTIIEGLGTWSKIETANVSGYVQSKYLKVGKA